MMTIVESYKFEWSWLIFSSLANLSIESSIKKSNKLVGKCMLSDNFHGGIRGSGRRLGERLKYVVAKKNGELGIGVG